MLVTFLAGIMLEVITTSSPFFLALAIMSYAWTAHNPGALFLNRIHLPLLYTIKSLWYRMDPLSKENNPGGFHFIYGFWLYWLR